MVVVEGPLKMAPDIEVLDEVAHERAEKARKEPESYEIKRIESGIPGLDRVCEGGLEKAGSFLLVGSAGTGKSTFASQFLYHGAAKHKEAGVYISFAEKAVSLKRHMGRFGWNLGELEKKNLFKVIEYKPHQAEKLVKQGGGPLRDAIKSLNAKRLAIDSITAYSLLFKDDYQRRESLLELFELLNKWDCTSIIISELPPKLAEEREGSVGFLTDAIIALSYQKAKEPGLRFHALEILKMRGTNHTHRICGLKFGKKGVSIDPHLRLK